MDQVKLVEDSLSSTKFTGSILVYFLPNICQQLRMTILGQCFRSLLNLFCYIFKGISLQDYNQCSKSQTKTLARSSRFTKWKSCQAVQLFQEHVTRTFPLWVWQDKFPLKNISGV